jgi:hypothetical protein
LAQYLVDEAAKVPHALFISGSGILMNHMMWQSGRGWTHPLFAHCPLSQYTIVYLPVRYLQSYCTPWKSCRT